MGKMENPTGVEESWKSEVDDGCDKSVGDPRVSRFRSHYSCSDLPDKRVTSGNGSLHTLRVYKGRRSDVKGRKSGYGMFYQEYDGSLDSKDNNRETCLSF